MKKDKIINLSHELDASQVEIESIHEKAKKANKVNRDDSTQINKLNFELQELAIKAGVSFHINDLTDTETKKKLSWDDEIFVKNNPLLLETKIEKEIHKNPQLLPSLTSLEYGIVGLAGTVAVILDFLVVKIPKDINYLGKFKQEGSGFTGWLRNLGVDEKGELNPFFKWLENTCHVPYDQSVNQNIPGFNPKSHRLLSLGHDPLFGLFFGIFDIMNGSLTSFDANGSIHVIKSYGSNLGDKVLSPFIWLGHIVSDMCTKMGVPIPGWGFLQLLQFGSFGAKERTIADISRWMYLNGYDLRHFITMSIQVAVIEIIIRGYHYLSSIKSEKMLNKPLIQGIASKELAEINSKLKLHKMLFLSHAIAASGNAIKVFTYGGNPLAINAPQWIMFVKESITMAKMMTRDKTSEKIIRNRNKIDEEWDNIAKDEQKTNFMEIDTAVYNDIFKK
jgi:hypothetical protein